MSDVFAAALIAPRPLHASRADSDPSRRVTEGLDAAIVHLQAAADRSLVEATVPSGPGAPDGSGASGSVAPSGPTARAARRPGPADLVLDSTVDHTVSPAVDVLVVEDDAAVRSSMAAILRGEGMQVLEAADGLEALALLRVAPVGVLVLDVRMPRLSGPELLDRLDEPPHVVVVTAGPYDEVLAHSSKVTWFLKKPVEPQELITIVGRCLMSRPGRDPTGPGW